MTDLRFPERLRLTARLGDRTLSAAWIEVELPMRRKNSYVLPTGPADSGGDLVITAADLLGMVKKINDLFPMDYTGLEGWTGELRLRPVNREAIGRLRHAYETWGHTGFYPADFSDQLDRLERALSDVPSATPIAIEVDTDLEEAANVTVVPLPAGGISPG